jgi:hypothetical protein
MSENSRQRRSRGEGHVRRYGKYWRGHVAIGGKRRYFSGPTRQSVIDKIRKALTESSEVGSPTSQSVDSGVTVGGFLVDWFERHCVKVRWMLDRAI